MELILISDSKLKIMLTEEDMFRYELCTESIDYDNTETRRAFWQILDEAKHRTGFDAASDRVFIQVYPSRGGGCEMYVTKLGGVPSAMPEHSGRKLAAESPQSARPHGRTLLYAFDSLDRLTQVCARLRVMGYSSESAAYADERGGYYLMITEHRSVLLPKRTEVGEYSFIEEYGERRRGQYDPTYIKEHCICIEPRRAVDALARLK